MNKSDKSCIVLGSTHKCYIVMLPNNCQKGENDGLEMAALT